jgi:hypothetical protein
MCSPSVRPPAGYTLVIGDGSGFTAIGTTLQEIYEWLPRHNALHPDSEKVIAVLSWPDGELVYRQGGQG